MGNQPHKQKPHKQKPPKHTKPPLYVGVFLDYDSIQRLAAWWERCVGGMLDERRLHHMTIKFKPTWEEIRALPIGQRVKLRVIGFAQDAKAQAVLVETPVASVNAYPHITIATDGTNATYSNDLLARGYKTVMGPTLRGVVDAQLRNNVTMCEVLTEAWESFSQQFAGV